MRIRPALLAAASASVLAVAPLPAHAVPMAGGFYGAAYLPCFGCGYVSTGMFDGSYHGLLGEAVYVAPATMHAQFDYYEPPGIDCVVSGWAQGAATIWAPTTGTRYFNFVWSRVGSTALISFVGDAVGNGFASFTVTSPFGNPCGGPVVAEVVGTLYGT